MFESYYEDLVWIFIMDISWLLVLLLSTLLTDLVRKISIFVFFSFVYYIFLAKIWFTVGHYFLWKCNALFACKSFCCSSITWMLFSYNLGILLRRVCIYIHTHTKVLLLLRIQFTYSDSLISNLQLRYTVNKSFL